MFEIGALPLNMEGTDSLAVSILSPHTLAALLSSLGRVYSG